MRLPRFARNDKRGELRSVVAEFISALYARSSPLRIRGARGVTVITPFYPPYLKGDIVVARFILAFIGWRRGSA